jgi:hypothetical protein
MEHASDRGMPGRRRKKKDDDYPWLKARRDKLPQIRGQLNRRQKIKQLQ